MQAKENVNKIMDLKDQNIPEEIILSLLNGINIQTNFLNFLIIKSIKLIVF